MLSTRREALRLVVDSFSCLAGVAILGYGLYLWSDYGFALPSPRWPRAARAVSDPSFGARWLVMLGFCIATYFGFFVLARTRSKQSDEDNSDSANI